MDTEQQVQRRKLEILKVLVVIVVTALITYFVTVKVIFSSFLSKSNSAYMSAKMSLVKTKLEESYIYDMPEDKMIEGAIKGYVNGLGDKYTQYLTEEDMKSLLESTSGSYVGIGVYMANNTTNNAVTIIGVIEGSAAESAGLQVGDIILKVNDTEYTGEQLDGVATAIKGEVGTDVKLSIMRGTEVMDFNIIRSSIKIKSISSSMLDNNLAYIKISSFDDGTADEFKAGYNELVKNNPKGLIIDLRNNGGGLVTESIKVAETMVDKGKTILITADKKKKEKIDKSATDPIVNIPVVILINENTASASEILAGALKDNCNYKIVGSKSYGKGVIQNVYTFSDGTGIKITTEEYFSPNHNQINKVGITPDIEIDLEPEWKNISNVPYENDIQLQRAMQEF